MPTLSKNHFYQAVRTKDARFDGLFFFGVKTTGIFCRCTCPSKPALKNNMVFFRTAEDARQAGFRPCLRCRPETRPGSPAWRGTSATVSRALQWMASRAEGQDLRSLGRTLGIGERHLRRLMKEKTGASPIRLWTQLRLERAQAQLVETRHSMARIALDSGFGSVRRFNDAFKRRFGIPPSRWRSCKTVVRP